MTEETQTSIIIDTGSWTCKIGYSYDDSPKLVLQTISSDPAYSEQMLFGKKAADNIAKSGFKNLCYGGNILDWDLMEMFWKHGLGLGLEGEDLNHPVLANFYPNSNKYTKEKQTQIFFESFNVSSYFAISNSLLILYSSGRVSGLIVDSGHSMTSVVPVMDGIVQYYNQSCVNYAGNEITQFFFDSNLPLKEMSQDIKEKHCRVSLDFQRESIDLSTHNPITLPDGTVYDMKDSAIRAPEGIFRPIEIGKKSIGLPDLILNSIGKCDIEYSKDLLNSIILAGGNTCFMNFNERLQREIQMRSSSTSKIKLLNYSDKLNAQWLGGAIISSIGSLQPIWITKSDYDEHGPAIIHRKCM